MLRARPLPAVFAIGGVNLAMQALALVSSLILARTLGPDARGQYGLALLWSGVFANVGLMGVHVYFARSAAHIDGENGLALLRRHALLIVSLLSAATLVLYWFAIPLVALNKPPEAASLLVVAGWSIPFCMWSAVQTQIELGRGSLRIYNLIRLAFSLFYLVGVVLTATIFETGAMSYLVAYVTVWVMSVVLSHLVIELRNRGARSSAAPAPPMESLTTSLRQALPYAATVALAALALAIDKIIVSLFLGTEDLGYYLVAISMTTLLAFGGDAIAKWLFSRTVCFSGVASETTWLGRRLRQLLVFYTILGFLATLVTPVAVLTLFGPDFAPAAWLAFFLAPVGIIQQLSRAYEETMLGLGIPQAQIKSNTWYIVVLSVVAASLVLFPTIATVALAVWLAAIVKLLVIAYQLQLYSGIALPDLVLVRRSDVAGLVHEARNLLAT